LEFTVQKLRSFRSVSVQLKKLTTSATVANSTHQKNEKLLPSLYPEIKFQLDEGLKKLLEVILCDMFSVGLTKFFILPAILLRLFE